MSQPATRTLAGVLRAKLAEPAPLRLLLGECGPLLAAPQGNAYAKVILGGETLIVPRLAGSKVVAGAPAYLLASPDFLLYLGSVSLAAP